jgi:hypothetical protein
MHRVEHAGKDDDPATSVPNDPSLLAHPAAKLAPGFGHPPPIIAAHFALASDQVISRLIK